MSWIFDLLLQVLFKRSKRLALSQRADSLLDTLAPFGLNASLSFNHKLFVLLIKFFPVFVAILMGVVIAISIVAVAIHDASCFTYLIPLGTESHKHLFGLLIKVIFAVLRALAVIVCHKIIVLLWFPNSQLMLSLSLHSNLRIYLISLPSSRDIMTFFSKLSFTFIADVDFKELGSVRWISLFQIILNFELFSCS